MLIKGLALLGKVISSEENLELITAIKKTNLSDENDGNIYGNSYGSQITGIDKIYDRLTTVIENALNYKLSKQNAYARVYKNGGKLKMHTDREGLDLTLSIQLNSNLSSPSKIIAKGLDNTIYDFELKDNDGLLILGREVEHGREDIVCNDESLECIFFHWKIVGIEYTEIENFLTDEDCDNVIEEQHAFAEGMVLHDGKAKVMDEIRSNKVSFYKSEEIDNKLKAVIGDFKLEGLQLLKYDKGNKFTPHHDYLFEGADGYKRLFTMLIYLNDDCQGGETNFPNAGVKVIPKKGKLLIWKNLLNNELNQLTLHESLPIKKGIKYALVNWAHIK